MTAKYTRRLRAERPNQPCECGCGQIPKSPGSRFCAGHGNAARPGLRERIYSQLKPCTEPGCGCDCLLWTGRVSKKGYGRTEVSDRTLAVHRIVWALEHGPIPALMTIDHVKDRGCRHKHCANLAHLDPVSNAVNCRRKSRMPVLTLPALTEAARAVFARSAASP